MLPPPKPKPVPVPQPVLVSMRPKTEAVKRKAAEPAAAKPSHHLQGVRLLTGSITRILRWNACLLADPKPWPSGLFLTVGLLAEYLPATEHATEVRFLLENLTEFQPNGKVKVKLRCTFFEMDSPFGSFSVGSLVRCVGRFILNKTSAAADGYLFHCVAIRNAFAR